MAVYNVFEPPQQDRDPGTHAARFAFVRDGFTWSAFLFAPLWMLRYRLWLAFVLYVIVTVGVVAAAHAAGLPGAGVFFILLLIAILIGLEAATLRRFGYARRRWRDRGIVVADDRETAERRFFESWVDRDTPPLPEFQPVPAATQTYRLVTDPAPEVIGSFPEPGAQR